MLQANATSMPQPAISPLGKATIARRQEREEARGSCSSGKGEGRAGFSCGVLQGQIQIVLLVTFGTVAYAELNAEVDAEAHEKHEERDRNQIERSDHGEPERCRSRKTHHQTNAHRNDYLPGSQGQPQNDHDTQRGGERVPERAMADD